MGNIVRFKEEIGEQEINVFRTFMNQTLNEEIAKVYSPIGFNIFGLFKYATLGKKLYHINGKEYIGAAFDFCEEKMYLINEEFNIIATLEYRTINSSKKSDTSKENKKYELLVEFYKEYIKSCTLQPIIFAQMAFPNGEMDVLNFNYVENEISYIAQFSRLIDVIRLGTIRDSLGKEINITFGQELYLRFTLATWIISQLNSYDELGKNIRTAMFHGYTQLIYVINLNVLYSGKWNAYGEVQLYKNNIEFGKLEFSNVIIIDEEIFSSSNPFQVYTTYNDTPKSLLTTFYNLVYKIVCHVPSLVDIKTNISRGRLYADFWLKKIMAYIILTSEEWKNLIYNEDNIEEISDVEYYLWNEDSLEKQIQMKFNIKLKILNKCITLDYNYTIPNARVFGLDYIDRLCNVVLENHNLEN